MGLDMHAVATSWEVPDLEHFDPNEYTELHYWRKHPNLHSWMKSLYYAKGGTEEPFNVVPVVLASEDLDRLEADVKAGSLPHTEGFFFGASDGSETEDDLAFIAKARDAMDKGLTVFYYAWW